MRIPTSTYWWDLSRIIVLSLVGHALWPCIEWRNKGCPEPLTYDGQGNYVSATHVRKLMPKTICNHGEKVALEEQVKCFYDFESLRINDENDVAYGKFVKGTTRKEERYDVGLPRCENMPTLPSNYEVYVSRLHSLVKCLKREPEVFEQYDDVIQAQRQNNIIDIVDHKQDDVPEEKTLFDSSFCLEERSCFQQTANCNCV